MSLKIPSDHDNVRLRNEGFHFGSAYINEPPKHAELTDYGVKVVTCTKKIYAYYADADRYFIFDKDEDITDEINICGVKIGKPSKMYPITEDALTRKDAVGYMGMVSRISLFNDDVGSILPNKAATHNANLSFGDGKSKDWSVYSDAETSLYHYEGSKSLMTVITHNGVYVSIYIIGDQAVLTTKDGQIVKEIEKGIHMSISKLHDFIFAMAYIICV